MDSLSRESVCREALALVDEEGLEALSMRRLGTRLHVEAMSLYKHVRDKADLLDALHAAVLGDLGAEARAPAGPSSFGVVNLVRMSMAPYRFFDECRERYGDMFSLKLPGQAAAVMCADPEAVKTLTTSGYADVTRFAEGVRFLLGDHAVIFQQDDPH